MPDKKGKPTESEIQRDIKRYLQATGWFVYKVQQGALSYKGISDLTGVKNGHTVHIEIKKPTGKQSDYQKQFESDIKDHGGQYVILKSLDDAIKLNEQAIKKWGIPAMITI